MDENEALFDEATASYGGRLKVEDLHEDTAKGLNYAAGRARGFLENAAKALPEMPPIHFDYVDSWDVNACAIPNNGTFFIGVFRGLAAALGLIFDRMLADPRILPFIGDPSKETQNLPLIEPVWLDFASAVESLPTFPRPQDPGRLAIANHLKDRAFDFIVAHEFGHIASGHLGYDVAKQGRSAIVEVGADPQGGDSAIISQVMEMDADRTAVQLSLGSEWLRVAGKIGRPYPPLGDMYNNPGQISMLWSYAVSTLIRLFGDARISTGHPETEDYPRPRLRSAICIQETGRLPRPQGISHPSFENHERRGVPMPVDAAYSDVERAFSLMTGRPQDAEAVAEVWGDNGKAQIRKLQEFWSNKLRDELIPYAHQPLNTFDEPLA